MELREWTVAGALVERDGQLLLVRNVRRGGFEDWTTPGGVIDAGDGSVLEGLAREVAEETGLVVSQWAGPVYEVVAVAEELGWRMRCEVHLAVAFDGELRVEDPDGIVVEARFCDHDETHARLDQCPPWVREPLADWLEDRWLTEVPGEHRRYHYAVHGAHRNELRVEREPPR